MNEHDILQTIIEKNYKTKIRTTYDISHSQREDAKGAWKFARMTNHPFNLHLSFSFKTDPAREIENVKRVRAVAHKLRMWLRYKKTSSNILWTRIVPKNNDREYVDILIHVPENYHDYFKKVVESWPFGIDVKPASYEEDQFHDGNRCTIFDLMFKAGSNETRFKQPDAPYQASEPMKGRRSFYSVKLWVVARQRHRAMNVLKTVDGTCSVHNGLTN